MTRRHLRYEGGGDPARGPAREFANEPASPQDIDEFPDLPPGNAPGGEAAPPPSEQPDLDRFADRLGLRRDGDRESGGDEVEAAGRPERLVKAAVVASRSLGATCFATISEASRRAADRLRPDEE